MGIFSAPEKLKVEVRILLVGHQNKKLIGIQKSGLYRSHHNHPCNCIGPVYPAAYIVPTETIFNGRPRTVTYTVAVFQR